MTNIRLSAKHHFVLPKKAFDVGLQIENQRAIRSGKSLVLLHLHVPLTPDVNRIIESLSSCVRGTDYIGWDDSDKRLRILFTEIETKHGEEIAKLLSTKIARVLRHESDLSLSKQTTVTVLPSGTSYVFA